MSLTLPLTAQMGLRLDGVLDLLDVNTSLTIHEDPEVNVFPDMEFRQEMFFLTISVSFQCHSLIVFMQIYIGAEHNTGDLIIMGRVG